MTKLKAAAEAGELDSEIEAVAQGDAEAAPKKTGAKSEGGSGRGWSDARRTAFVATIAVRNAGKEG